MNKEKREQIHLRVTETEKQFIANLAYENKMTITDYLVNLATRKNVIVATDLPRVTIEIARIGNNINQIATICNTQKYINKKLSDVLLDNQEEINKLLTNHYNLIFSQIKSEDVIDKNEKAIKDLKTEIKELKEIILKTYEEK